VLTDLNPWVVMLHFLASMLMIGLNVAFLHQAGPPRMDAPAHLLLGRLPTALVAVTAASVTSRAPSPTVTWPTPPS
jgi:hypothetical protein